MSSEWVDWGRVRRAAGFTKPHALDIGPAFREAAFARWTATARQTDTGRV
jgi:hypothetical protein